MIINIGKDFSTVPAGRYLNDGPNSGERFREEILKSVVVNRNEYDIPVTIILDDGVEGYGSSFLNEAFGGLVRKGYAKPDEVLKCFDFEYSDDEFDYYKQRIISYIKEAIYGSER